MCPDARHRHGQTNLIVLMPLVMPSAKRATYAASGFDTPVTSGPMSGVASHPTVPFCVHTGVAERLSLKFTYCVAVGGGQWVAGPSRC